MVDRQKQLFRELVVYEGRAHPKQIAKVVEITEKTVQSNFSNWLMNGWLERTYDGTGDFKLTEEGYAHARELFPDGIPAEPIKGGETPQQKSARKRYGSDGLKRTTKPKPKPKAKPKAEEPKVKIGELYELVGLDSNKRAIVRHLENHTLHIITPI